MQVETQPENFHHANEYFCPEEISYKLDQSINEIAKKAGFTKPQILKKCISTNGGNYLGMLYEIDVKGPTKEGHRELNIFVKSIIPGQSDLEIVSVANVYKTEVFTYKELSKIFEELQEDAQVPIDERYKMVKSYDETNAEVIIMENVSRRGFGTCHRMDVVSLKFAEMAMQELARFHALSFVLKENRPGFFEKRIKTLKSPYNIGDQWRGLVQSMLKITLDNVEESAKERLEKFCEGLAERFARHFEDEAIKRCLVHGDYRPNNILTKIIDGEVSEIIPVDYQLIHHGCPVIDFIYFMIVSTDREFRKNHMLHLKDLYHETLTKFLKYFDLDVNMFYPREQFDTDYESQLEYGLTVGITMLPFMFVSEDDVPDVTKKEITSLTFKVHDKFKDRVQGIVDDYIEWGIL